MGAAIVALGTFFELLRYFLLSCLQSDQLQDLENLFCIPPKKNSEYEHFYH